MQLFFLIQSNQTAFHAHIYTYHSYSFSECSEQWSSKRSSSVQLMSRLITYFELCTANVSKIISIDNLEKYWIQIVRLNRSLIVGSIFALSLLKNCEKKGTGRKKSISKADIDLKLGKIYSQARKEVSSFCEKS